MAEAISFDESFWIEEIDPTDPESLSNVSVDYTPAFNLGTCFKENFEIYLKYIALLDPIEVDVLILYHYCDKKVKEIAKILRTTPVKISGLIGQAEQRLALLLHINLLLSHFVLEELNTLVEDELERQVFKTFLREVSRRRTAHVMGLSFHQVNSIIKQTMERISSNLGNSLELSELVKLLTPVITPPRETRQLDPTERICIFDIISCPQQTHANITLVNPDFSLGCFGQPNLELLQGCFAPEIVINNAGYYSVSQAILAQQLKPTMPTNLWTYLNPPFITRIVRNDVNKRPNKLQQLKNIVKTTEIIYIRTLPKSPKGPSLIVEAQSIPRNQTKRKKILTERMTLPNNITTV